MYNAVAQGAIALANFTPNSGDVKTKSSSVDTNGYIQSGGIVENEIDFSYNIHPKSLGISSYELIVTDKDSIYVFK